MGGSKAHKALNRRKWAVVRRAALDRDGWRCRACGKAGRLQVDHILRLEDGGEPYDLDNLQSLCIGCHRDKTALENSAPKSPEQLAWDAYMDSVK